MTLDPVWLAIIGMTLVTFGERAIGFYIVRKVPLSPRVEQTLDALPGVVLIAIVAPALIAGGWEGWAGGALLLTLFLTTRRSNLSVFSGLGLVILLRALF